MEALTPPSAEGFTFDLPFPPSVNHYWRPWRGRMVISPRGRAYRASVRSALRDAALPGLPIEGPVAVRVEAFPPDQRRHDLDNLLKAIGDGLGHAGVYRDDHQIAWLLIERAGVVPGGRVRVTVRPRGRRDQSGSHP